MKSPFIHLILASLEISHDYLSKTLKEIKVWSLGKQGSWQTEKKRLSFP